jgi:hypothetical protein
MYLILNVTTNKVYSGLIYIGRPKIVWSERVSAEIPCTLFRYKEQAEQNVRDLADLTKGEVVEVLPIQDL